VSDDEAVMADALDAEIPATEQPNIETVRGMTEIGTDASHARGHPEHQSTAEVQAYAEEQVSMPKHGVFNGAEEESSAVELQDQHALPHQEDLNDEPADSVVEPEQEIQSDIHALSTESDPNVSTCVKEVASQQCLEEDAANNLEANQGSSDEASLVFTLLHTRSHQMRHPSPMMLEMTFQLGRSKSTLPIRREMCSMITTRMGKGKNPVAMPQSVQWIALQVLAHQGQAATSAKQHLIQPMILTTTIKQSGCVGCLKTC